MSLPSTSRYGTMEAESEPKFMEVRNIRPNENIQQIVYIKSVITRPNIIIGEYSYYDDVNGAGDLKST